jgi:hypothetical protein
VILRLAISMKDGFSFQDPLMAMTPSPLVYSLKKPARFAPAAAPAPVIVGSSPFGPGTP